MAPRDHSFIIFSTILPENLEAFRRAQQILTVDHFIPNTPERQLWDILTKYASKYGGIPSDTWILDKLRAASVRRADILVLEDAVVRYSQSDPRSLSVFAASVDALHDDYVRVKTGQALVESFEILEQGAVIDGEQLKGHEAARERIATRVREIEAEFRIGDVSEGDVSQDSDFMAEYEAVKQANLENTGGGIGFGIRSLDEHTGGVSPGDLVLIGGYTGQGKASPLWTPVLTPHGWVTMGDLSVGDFVIGANGRPTRVVGVFDRGPMSTFRLTFSDDSSVVTAGDHLWSVQDQNDRAGYTKNGWRVVSTDELSEGLAAGRRFYLPIVSPVEYATRPALPIDPYALGLLLGDGALSRPDLRFTTADQELVVALASRIPEVLSKIKNHPYDYYVEGRAQQTKKALQQLGLMGKCSDQKFIPRDYMYASVDDRWSLLRGLMDTDGYVGLDGSNVEFDSASEELARDVQELAESLGGTCRLKRVFERHWKVSVKVPENPFSLPWKAQRFRPHRPTRTLRRVEAVGVEDVRCIAVDADDHLYVTERFIVTHNTQMLCQMAWHAAVHQKKNVFFSTTETVRRQVETRIVARHSREPQFNLSGGLNSRDILKGTLTPDHEKVMAEVVEDLRTGGYGSLRVSQTPSDATLAFVESRFTAWQQSTRRSFDLLLLDSIYLLRPSRKRNSEREEFNDLLRDSKRLATALGVSIVSPWQITRTAWEKAIDAGQEYGLSSMSDTSEAEKSASLVLTMLCDPAEPEMVRAQILKNRDGEAMATHVLYIDYRNAYLADVGGSDTASRAAEQFDPMREF